MSPRPLAQLVGLLSALTLATAGCTPAETKKPVFPVQGSVVVDGKPAVKALVVFNPRGEADPKVPRPTGEVGADGGFSLSTYTTGDGAPAGEYAVTVQWFAGSSPIGGDADSEGDRLGGRYSNPATTPLRAKVEAGPNQLKPFVLK